MPIFQSSSGFVDWKQQHEISSKDLIETEEEHLRQSRRQALRDAGVDAGGPTAGLALSGGGIRSATFSLGLLRELSAQGLLHRFDYLSTVSGGSYIGAYYAALFAKRREAEPLIGADAFQSSTSAAASDPFSLHSGKARASLDWLRQSGRYLAPSGSGDYWYALGLLVRNWLGLHLVIGSAMMLMALIAAGFRLLMFGALWPNIRPGPTALLHAPLLLFLLVPVTLHVILAWGYWMTKRGTTAPTTFAQFGSTVLAIGGIILAASETAREWAFPGVDHVREGAAGLAFFAIAGLLALALSCLRAPPAADGEETWDSRRKWLTGPLRWCASSFVLILVAAIVDALGFLFYRFVYDDGAWPIVVPAAVAAVAVPAGRWLLARLVQLSGSVSSPAAGGAKGKPRFFTPERLLSAGAAIAALVLIALVIGLWTVLAYRAVWPDLGSAQPRTTGAACPLTGGDSVWLACTPLVDGAWGPVITVWASWTAILAFLSFCIAFSPAFLNLSGLTSFYAGRLRRAYLGAGNAKRLGLDAEGEPQDGRTALDRWEASDDILLEDYFKPGSAAPLHLINITLNETRGTGSNIVQQDRRGRNLVVSPTGIYCESDTTGKLYRVRFNEGDHEPLPLSAWVAISGAAFSTGLGSRTGFPKTQLAGLANVRLGYWWRARSGLGNSITQKDLLREFTGDFSGPNEKYWYLSDGGHFENTGAYELIRRQLSFIVVSDNGMDERFEYEDIANLVRKARIDFDCEIDFLNKEELDDLFREDPALRPSFGTLVQIAGGEPGAGASSIGAVKDGAPGQGARGGSEAAAVAGADDRAVAALARLKYRDGAPGTLLLIKPRLTGDGPADLIRYKAVNGGFPQQSTLDQFFDEAQWESYYHLGRLIGQAVFGVNGRSAPRHKAGGDWRPHSLRTIF